MSRTYRKISTTQEYFLDWDWEVSVYGRYLQGKRRTPSKKIVSMAHRDGGSWYNSGSHKWYFNQVSRVRRTNDKKEFSKLKFYDGSKDRYFMEGYDFDDSKAIKKRKGIWWEIY